MNSNLPRETAARRAGADADPENGHVSALDISVEDAILARRSIRAFLPKPVPQATLRRLLDIARHAPSGSNIQPWRVHVLTGVSLTAYSEALIAAARNNEPRDMEYQYYAPEWREPFQARRRACGFGLYSAMGIERGDTQARREAFERNYLFFGAPAGFLLWIPSDLEHGSWLDYGTFIQSISLTAQNYGLATIAQGALGEYPHVAHEMFHMGNDYTLIGGMSIGWPDSDAPVNSFQPDRIEVDEFVTWLD